jgi:UDP-N-acetylglucosamine--N-acetylmuramyl-(pentapeptide) pyrophosphoryl-undecaprenol N-acetylglucosamine transferase
VAPALAVAGALRAEGAEVEFVGGDRAETELVPRAGYPLHRLSVEGMSRTNPVHAARALMRAGGAFLHARALLRELQADAVLGAGGYVSGPVGLAALSVGTPLVLTEADSRLGLANRVLARGARRVCLAFPIAGREGRFRVTGRPIPVPDADRARAREHFGLAPQQRCVLVFGGSLGARSINFAALGGLAPLALDGSWRLTVLHIAGRRDYASLLPGVPERNYALREYMQLEEFAQALAAADLAVARSGGSVFELAAYGLPAVLVPYPHASADHQSTNARWMGQAGAASVIADAELSPARLREEVGGLLADAERLAAMARASRELARPDAARDVAEELLAAAAARDGGSR